MAIGVADLLIRVRSDTTAAVGGLNALSLGLVGLGVGAAAASVQFIKMGIDAQDQLAIVQGLTGSSKSQMSQYVTGLETMATELGFTMSAGAQGLYYIVSAGFAGADALTVLRVAAEGALASGSSLRDVSNGLTSAMNAYGAKAQEAAHYSDIMATAVTYGKQTFADFADNVGKAALMASTSHIPFEQLAAAEAALTEKGLPAANAMTYLRYLFSKTTVDVPALQKAVEKLGGTFDANKYQSLDLAQKLLYLQNQTGLTEGQFITLTGGARGSQAALGLVGDKGVAFEKILAKMGDSAGLTAAAFKVHDATITGGFEDIRAALSVTAYEVVNFATSFLHPPFTNITDAIGSVNKKFIEMQPALAQGVGAVLGVVYAFGTLIGKLADAASWFLTDATGIGILKSALITFGVVLGTVDMLKFLQGFIMFPTIAKSLYTVFADLTAGIITLSVPIDAGTTSIWALNASLFGLEAVTLPVWALVAAIVAVVAAIAGLAYWFTSTQSGMKAWSEITHAAGSDMAAFGTVVHDDVLPVLQALGAVLLQVGGWIKTQFLAVIQFLTPAFQQASTALKQFADGIATELAPGIRTFARDLPGAIQTFQKIWSVIWPALALDVTAAWSQIRDVTETVWGIIEGVVMIYWSLIQGGLTIGLDLLTMKWGKAWGDFKGMLSGIWAGIEQIFGSVISGMTASFEDNMITITTVLSKIPGPVGSMASAVLNELKNLRSNAATETSKLSSNTTQSATTMSTSTVAAVADMHGRVSAHVTGMSSDVTRATSTMKTTSVKQSQDMGATIQETLQNTWNTVTGNVGAFMSNFGKTVHGGFSAIGADIGNVFSQQGASLKGTLATLGTTIGGFFSGLGTAIHGALNAIGSSLGGAFAAAGTTVHGILNNIGAFVGGFFSSLGTTFNNFWKWMQPFWNTIGGILMAVIEIAVTYIGQQFSALGKTTHTQLNDLGAWIGQKFSDLGTTMKSLWNATVTWIGDRMNAFGTLMRSLWNGLTSWIGAQFSSLGASLRGIWDATTSYIGNKMSGFGTTVRAIWNPLVGWVGTQFSNLGTGLRATWDTTTAYIGNKMSGFGAIMRGLWNGLTSSIGTQFNNLGTGLHKTWDSIVSYAGSRMSDFGAMMHKAWDSVVAYVGNKFSGLGTTAQGVWNGIVNGAKGALNQLIDKMNAGWSGIISFINGIANGLDAIEKSIGIKPDVPTIPRPTPIPHLASGTSNWPGGMALVGEEGPEIVQLPSGATVLPAALSKMLLGLMRGGLPGLAGGVGDIAGSVLGWITGGAGNVLSHLLAAANVNLGAPFSTIESGLKNLFTKDLLPTIQKWIQSVLPAQSPGMPTGSLGHTHVSGTVAQWLLQAIADTGVPQSWLTGLEIIAQHESGGNPNAQNNTDINARRGDPSRGLMQMIMTTFMANALPGMTDIFNPIDNAAAAIRYIERRYGGIQNVPGVRAVESGHSYVGYANGGWINEPIAGIGRSGTRYRFGEQGPEYVSPNAAKSAAKTFHFENHFHGDVNDSMIAKVVREQAWQARLHGGG